MMPDAGKGFLAFLSFGGHLAFHQEVERGMCGVSRRESMTERELNIQDAVIYFLLNIRI